LLPSARKDRKRKSEPKYTTRQSSNEPRKIPHITSQKKRRSLHPSSSANHRAGSSLTGRGWRKKARGRETSLTTFTAHLLSARSLNSHDRTVFGRLKLARKRKKFRSQQLAEISSFMLEKKKTPTRNPTKFTRRSRPPALSSSTTHDTATQTHRYYYKHQSTTYAHEKNLRPDEAREARRDTYPGTAASSLRRGTPAAVEPCTARHPLPPRA